MASGDAYDLFDTSLSALFSVPPIAFSTASPDEAHEYTPPCGPEPTSPGGPGRTVRLWLPHPPADLYTALQANNLWLSGVFLADSIARGDISFARGSTVAELGAGAGLPSIMAWRAGANVTCTDYDSEVVIDTLRRNFEAEAAAASAAATQSSTAPAGPGSAASAQHGSWAVLGHSWGTSPAPLLAHAPGGFDAVILADTLWSSDKHAILLDSVCTLLRRPRASGALVLDAQASGAETLDVEASGAVTHDAQASVSGSDMPAPAVVHVAAGLHTGRGPVDRFLSLARARGLTPTFEREVCWQPGGGWADHAYDGTASGEERGVVVYYTLRWA